MPTNDDDFDGLEPVDDRGRTSEDHSREKQITRRKQAKTSAWRLADSASIPERLAVGLSIHPTNPELAAHAVGLILTSADLKKQVKEARKKYPDIISRDPKAYNRIAWEVRMLAGIHLRDAIGLVPPASIAATIRQLAQVSTEDDKVGNQGTGQGSALIINFPTPYDPPNEMPGPEGIPEEPSGDQ